MSRVEGEDTAVTQHLIEHRALEVAPFVDVGNRNDNEVDGNAHIAERLAEPDELGAAAFDLGLDDKEVQVAVGAAFTSGPRAEQDHPGIGRCRGQTATRLGDQFLAGHRLHNRKGNCSL